MNFLSFNKLAAARGDGLHTKLLDLLAARATFAASHSNVVELAAHRDGAHMQSGPNPAAALPTNLPAGVIRFPSPAPSKPAPRRSTAKS